MFNLAGIGAHTYDMRVHAELVRVLGVHVRIPVFTILLYGVRWGVSFVPTFSDFNIQIFEVVSDCNINGNAFFYSSVFELAQPN